MLKQCNIRVHYIQIFIINFVSVYWLLINRTLQQTAFCVFKGRFVFVHKIWEYKQYMYIWFSKQLFPEQLQLVLEKYFALPWFNICLAKDVVNNYFKASVSSCGIFYRILIERIPMNGHTLMPNAPVWYLHFFFFPRPVHSALWIPCNRVARSKAMPAAMTLKFTVSYSKKSLELTSFNH